MNKTFANTRIEYHILQSFPVTCLNRDDVGAPKTAVVGGATRARVSSQCWKRQVRLGLKQLGLKLGVRTKKVEELLLSAAQDLEIEESHADVCAKQIAAQLSDDTLLFISETEARAFMEFAREQNFDLEKLKDKSLAKIAKRALNPAIDALDIALFGRMVAKAAEMNVEAAASFSHAISTHKVSNEVEFFTALDDRQDEPGSAHMGSLEFNSATYYRYVSLDLGQLSQTLGTEELCKAVNYFTRALYVAVPNARQTTQSGASPWEFARVLIRRGQRLQVPFETPVKAKDGGYLIPSLEVLKGYLDKKEKLSGSLYGRIGSYDWGENENFSIDDLIQSLEDLIAKVDL